MIYACSEQPIKFFTDIKNSDHDAKLSNITTLEELYNSFLSWSCKCGHKQGIYDINKFKLFAKRELGAMTKTKHTVEKNIKTKHRAWDTTTLIFKELE
jgi:hypothetical protein